MHAFLIVGEGESREEAIKRISEGIGGRILEFTLEKIDDVRQIESFTRFSLKEKTIIIAKDIDEASEEALNAFLKALEEPQENLFYILTAQSLANVLPTIVSRCQVIRLSATKIQAEDNNIEKFLKLSTSAKLSFVERIREREEALSFVKNFVIDRHSALVKEKNNISVVSKQAELGMQVMSRLKSNGNVFLQLTYFVINLPS